MNTKDKINKMLQKIALSGALTMPSTALAQNSMADEYNDFVKEAGAQQKNFSSSVLEESSAMSRDIKTDYTAFGAEATKGGQDTAQKQSGQAYDVYYWGVAETLGLEGEFSMPRSDKWLTVVTADNGAAVMFGGSCPIFIGGVIKDNKIEYYILDHGKRDKLTDPQFIGYVNNANKEYGNPESAFSKALKMNEAVKAKLASSRQSTY